MGSICCVNVRARSSLSWALRGMDSASPGRWCGNQLFRRDQQSRGSDRLAAVLCIALLPALPTDRTNATTWQDLTMHPPQSQSARSSDGVPIRFSAGANLTRTAGHTRKRRDELFVSTLVSVQYSPPRRVETLLTLADAKRIIAAGEKKAAEIGQPMNIAVADAGGNLIAHVRMDNAWMGSIDISIKKAWTSRAFDIATKDLAEHSQSGNQFFGIHASNNGKVMIFAGGIPLKKDGKVIGAIGVSGGSGDQDHAVAEAGAAAL